ncbi:MAG TPA: S8 family serine peptidase, partial [Puia sp.]|nr:S8 family serine peptidase [Puia sp.]
MKTYYFLFSICILLVFNAFSQVKPQSIRLRTGIIIGDRNIQRGTLIKEQLKTVLFKKHYYAAVQFESIPNEVEKAELSRVGVSLFDFVPQNTFMAELREDVSLSELRKHNVSGIYMMGVKSKISHELVNRGVQSKSDDGSVVAVTYFGSLSRQNVIAELVPMGAEIVQAKIQPKHVIFIRASLTALNRIANLPFVVYLTAQRLHDVSLNYNNHAAYGIDALNPVSGRNLRGSNVTVGVGDDADPSSHIDFSGRLIDRTPAGFNNHGTHVTGTTAGGGILNPMYTGMAPLATIVAQYFSDILVNAPTYMGDFGMVLTNNSYYSGLDGCQGEGQYDPLSNFVDDQLYQYDSLLHVFASGNDGGSNCTPYAGSYGTIKSGFQCGKNVLTVGADSSSSHLIAAFSSGGPVNDGRIKPEIVAGGVGVISTYAYNTYWPDQGTSMAAPTVTGTLALLYQRYRQLHGGQNPQGALMKAVICNSADDEGNPGPDFLYGFGKLNARTAVETIESGQYFSGSISNAGNSTFTIHSVPGGAYQLKVMLYWNDPAAAPYATTSLVNNLDLTVTGSDAQIHHPLILNANPAAVSNSAVEGIDSINNVEQVVITNPPGGDFVINVQGTNVPEGPQNFVVVYQIINPSVTVEYPFGGETWVPGQTENIRWSAFGGAGNSFTLEYSVDGGVTWSTINNAIPDGTFSFPWTVPGIATGKARIRITRNNTAFSDMSDFDFVILGQPA